MKKRENEMEETHRLWRQLLALVAFGAAAVEAWAKLAGDPGAADDVELVARERAYERDVCHWLEYLATVDAPDIFAATLDMFALRRRLLGHAWRDVLNN